jgi:hypothetical protein
LSPKELFNYRAACRYTNKIYRQYTACAFSVEASLATFFTDNEILVFRMLQAQHGIVISGSFALQFFARVHYTSSDLDLYVEYRHGFQLCAWLVSEGFICISSSDFAKQYITGQTSNTKLSSNTGLHRYDSYVSSKIFTALTFTRGGKEVQVMTTKGCAMDVILNYHISTCGIYT